MPKTPTSFRASAPGKVNLHLGVGEARADGYHELVTVFQAVDRREQVTLHVVDGPAVGMGSVVRGMHTEFHVQRPAEDIDTPANLAWRAVDAVVDECRKFAQDLPPVRIEVEKHVFVAGGMAGGSADAAAALVAAARYAAAYTGVEIDADRLHQLGAELGADVPFCLRGGTALGTGRGDELVDMLTRGDSHWVFVNPKMGISTGKAFGLLDDMRHDDPALVPHLRTAALSQTLARGDQKALALHLHNDLESAALRMQPRLQHVIRAAEEIDGVLRAIVSGSGPTIAALCAGAHGAASARAAMQTQFPEYEVVTAAGPVPGAQ